MQTDEVTEVTLKNLLSKQGTNTALRTLHTDLDSHLPEQKT